MAMSKAGQQNQSHSNGAKCLEEVKDRRFNMNVALLRKALQVEVQRLGSLPVLSKLTNDRLSAAQHQELIAREAGGVQKEGQVISNILQSEKTLEDAKIQFMKAQICLIQAYHSGVKQFQSFYKERGDLHKRVLGGDTSIFTAIPQKEEIITKSKADVILPEAPTHRPPADNRFPEVPELDWDSLLVTRRPVSNDTVEETASALGNVPTPPLLEMTNLGIGGSGTPKENFLKPRSGNRSKPSSNGSFITSPTEEKEASRKGVPALPTFLLKKQLLGTFSLSNDEENNHEGDSHDENTIQSGKNANHKHRPAEDLVFPQMPALSQKSGTTSGATFSGLSPMPEMPDLDYPRLFGNHGNAKISKVKNREVDKGRGREEGKGGYSLPKELQEYKEAMASKGALYEESFTVAKENQPPPGKQRINGMMVQEFSQAEYKALSQNVRDQLTFPELNNAVLQLRQGINDFVGVLSRKSLQKMMEKHLSPVQVVVFCSALVETGRFSRVPSK